MSITQEAYTEACKLLQQTWLDLPSTGTWDDVKVMRVYDTAFLRITRAVPSLGAQNSTLRETNDDVGCLNEDDDDDDDGEALAKSKPASDTIKVAFDIIYSPSYQVPVLYLDFQSPHPHHRGPPSTDETYDLLVPASQKAQMRVVGVIGALSMTEHPIFGTPVWFVHPCRTQEAMAAVMGGAVSVHPDGYLVKWLGVVGAGVGLSVPVEVGMAVG